MVFQRVGKVRHSINDQPKKAVTEGSSVSIWSSLSFTFTAEKLSKKM